MTRWKHCYGLAMTRRKPLRRVSICRRLTDCVVSKLKLTNEVESLTQEPSTQVMERATQPHAGIFWHRCFISGVDKGNSRSRVH